ncbi:hypothetical protein [Streptomyces sp. NBC_01803]|uniref:hypothetical protein n=1 Tax=Streptomyces sp. NBC_01803 TaxID=2975946 RepID=UPI002DDC20D6|nr:hypothetical protein [Streptomyces sp. NBC_01803]WSA45558.1 hypothetical protein OIE51_15935 [Streptomyces sp. NBC_01803]
MTRRMPELPKDELIRLYRAGRSLNSLARDHGVSAPYLTKRFKEWNVPLRDRAQAAKLRR